MNDIINTRANKIFLNDCKDTTFLVVDPNSIVTGYSVTNFRDEASTEIKMTKKEIMEYKFVTELFLDKIITLIMDNEYKFTSANVDNYILNNEVCPHFDILMNNLLFIKAATSTMSFDNFLSRKFLTMMDEIIEKSNFNSDYMTFIGDDHIYIKMYGTPISTNKKDLKIHLMFKPKYHILILIMLMKIFKKKNLKYLIKTGLRYYSSLITPPYLDGTVKKWYYGFDYRGPLIVIYCEDIAGFRNIISALLECFDGLFDILGSNLTPTFNIKINRLIYYSIGARYNKTDMLADVLADCNNKNYARFSVPGINVWDNCSNQEHTAEKCIEYSENPKNTRLTYDEPMCRFIEGKCKPKPLSTCIKDDVTNQDIFINNKDDYALYANKCTDHLCFQDMQFTNYSTKKKEQERKQQTLDDIKEVKEYDAKFVEDIEIELNKILEEKSRLSMVETGVGRVEQSIETKRNTIKYLKYKLKYLQIKNKNLK
jgi:hypothetical protein